MCNCNSCNNNLYQAEPFNKKVSKLSYFPLSKLNRGLSNFGRSPESLKNGLVQNRFNSGTGFNQPKY